MSTFNLIQPQPSFCYTHLRLSPCWHSTPSTHRGSLHTSTGSTRPNSTTSTHRWSHHQAHPHAAHIQIQQPPHTGGHTIRHIHRQHTSKFNNLHTQVVTPSGTSTGSTRPNSTTSTHRWSHHQAHPQAAHVQIQQHPHTGGHTIRHSMFTTHNQITQSPQSVHQERQKKVPRNHIITLGIPPKSITQPYYHSWNTQAKHLVQCKSTTLCVPHRAAPKAHR